jgi:hypothetical protein
MPFPNLSFLCSDFLLEHYPDAYGEHLADLMATALWEAESLVLSTHHHLRDSDIRAHLRSFFDGFQVETGVAERVARGDWYLDLCSDWVSDLDTGDLLLMEVAIAIDLAVSDARVQMEAGRWPSSGLAMARMAWLLRQAITRLRQSVRRQNE